MTKPLAIEQSIYERLADYFPLECIHWRVGSTNKKAYEARRTKTRRGMPLAYLDARDVMDRLDAVCGPEGWQDEYVNAGNGATCCRVGVLVDGNWIWKADGAGRTDFEGDKGQFSDAFKRAAVKHGIGRYLYGHATGWIELDDYWNIPPVAKSRLEKSLAEFTGQPYTTKADSRDVYAKLETGLRASATTIKSLEMYWKGKQGEIKTMPKDWQANLTEEKDRLKAELEKDNV